MNAFEVGCGEISEVQHFSAMKKSLEKEGLRGSQFWLILSHEFAGQKRV
jgi:hypothetical protein